MRQRKYSSFVVERTIENGVKIFRSVSEVDSGTEAQKKAAELAGKNPGKVFAAANIWPAIVAEEIKKVVFRDPDDPDAEAVDSVDVVSEDDSSFNPSSVPSTGSLQAPNVELKVVSKTIVETEAQTTPITIAPAIAVPPIATIVPTPVTAPVIKAAKQATKTQAEAPKNDVKVESAKTTVAKIDDKKINTPSKDDSGDVFGDLFSSDTDSEDDNGQGTLLSEDKVEDDKSSNDDVNDLF